MGRRNRQVHDGVVARYSVVPGNLFEVCHPIDDAMGQDGIAFVKEMKPIFLVHFPDLVAEVRRFQERVRDLRSESNQVTAGAGAASFARSESVVANDAAEAVRRNDVRFELIDFIEQPPAQLSLQARFLVPLRHHAGMPAVRRFRDRFGPIENTSSGTKPAADPVRSIAQGRADGRETEPSRRAQIGQEIELARKEIVVIDVIVFRLETVIEVLDAGRDRLFPRGIPGLRRRPLGVSNSMNEEDFHRGIKG